jgi:transposase
LPAQSLSSSWPWHWERIESFFPHRVHHGGRGRPLEDHHRIFSGILWRLHTGAPWRDIPEYFGPWQTVYSRFRLWRRDGTLATLLTYLLENLEQRGRLGHDLWLASGGWDKVVRVWDVLTGYEVLALTGHVNAVTSITFSSDGRSLPAGSASGEIRVWQTAR